MINLQVEDRQKLVSLLSNMPELSNDIDRREMLEYAGLKQLIPMINLSPPTFTAVNQIVSYLSNYGRLTYEHEALGLFLNAIKTLVGIEHQRFIDDLLIKYEMMTPVASSPGIANWHGSETQAEVLEKIIGKNTLRPIAFLEQGLKIARSVAYIGVYVGADRWSGTGFLIAPDLILTNHHVLPSCGLLPACIFRFNFEETFEGKAKTPSEFRAKDGGIFHTNKDLDYSIVQLEGQPGIEWGWTRLLANNIRRGERANIIQHPNGRPKEISFQNNFIEYVGDNVIQYVTSTQPGSSGSPVLNDSWQIVAIHHAGGNIQEPSTQRRYFRNEGILINSILKNLTEEIKALLNTVPAN